MRQARLFLSETGTIVPSDTGTIVLKWDWHNCSQVKLALLFPSGFWLSSLCFALQFGLWHNFSLVGFTCEQLCHVPGLWHMIPFLVAIIHFYVGKVKINDLVTRSKIIRCDWSKVADDYRKTYNGVNEIYWSTCDFIWLASSNIWT